MAFSDLVLEFVVAGFTIIVAFGALTVLAIVISSVDMLLRRWWNW